MASSYGLCDISLCGEESASVRFVVRNAQFIFLYIENLLKDNVISCMYTSLTHVCTIGKLAVLRLVILAVEWKTKRLASTTAVVIITYFFHRLCSRKSI